MLLASAAIACSPSAPTPTALPTPPLGQGFLMTGRVLNDSGSVVRHALVALDNAACAGSNSAPCTTYTNDLGQYQFTVTARTATSFVSAFADGYEVDIQWVPVGLPVTTRDLKLRATRPIPAGASTIVTVDGSSALCTDLEDNWKLDHRCEIVVIESGAGTLDVRASPVSGAAMPFMFWYTSGNYAGFIARPEPGLVSFAVRGGTYRVMVGLPDGWAPQQFNVTTSLR